MVFKVGIGRLQKLHVFRNGNFRHMSQANLLQSLNFGDLGGYTTGEGAELGLKTGNTAARARSLSTLVAVSSKTSMDVFALMFCSAISPAWKPGLMRWGAVTAGTRARSQRSLR